MYLVSSSAYLWSTIPTSQYSLGFSKAIETYLPLCHSATLPWLGHFQIYHAGQCAQRLLSINFLSDYFVTNICMHSRVVHGSDGPADRVGSRFCRILAGRVGSAVRIFLVFYWLFFGTWIDMNFWILLYFIVAYCIVDTLLTHDWRTWTKHK